MAEWGDQWIPKGVISPRLVRRIAEGRPTPSWDRRPILRQDAALAFECWVALNPRRTPSMGSTPLPWPISEFLAWCDMHDIKGEDRAALWHSVEEADRVYRGWLITRKDERGD